MKTDYYKVEVSRKLEELIPGFMRNRQKELEALRLALASSNFEKLRQLGHRMKRVGDSYGFYHITLLGKQIENSAGSENRAELEAVISNYAEYLPRVQIVYR